MNATYHIKDVTIIILQVCLLHRSSEDMVAWNGLQLTKDYKLPKDYKDSALSILFTFGDGKGSQWIYHISNQLVKDDAWVLDSTFMLVSDCCVSSWTIQ